MTLQWAARLGLALWILYDIAFLAERAPDGRSAGLRWFGISTGAAVTGVLVWAGWFS